MSEWLDLMIDEVDRKRRAAREAEKERQRRDEDTDSSTGDNSAPASNQSVRKNSVNR